MAQIDTPGTRDVQLEVGNIARQSALWLVRMLQ
jgi:hypothetical protein